MMAAPDEGEILNERAHLRRSILELAPLELDCMNALWSVSEGTVRQIQQLMVATRPRAYTTIMTILDRLAQKGVVARQKTGRAYIYRPNLTAEQARTHAIERIVDGFFKGSTQALAAQLAGAPAATGAKGIGVAAAHVVPRVQRAAIAEPKASAALANASENAIAAVAETPLDAALL
ncbi:MAG: BlaI/MecI/CopY family transcriptional regulator [Candidatus Acidiferrales bacterium]